MAQHHPPNESSGISRRRERTEEFVSQRKYKKLKLKMQETMELNRSLMKILASMAAENRSLKRKYVSSFSEDSSEEDNDYSSDSSSSSDSSQDIVIGPKVVQKSSKSSSSRNTESEKHKKIFNAAKPAVLKITSAKDSTPGKMAVENRNNSVDTSNISSTSNIVDKEEASKRIKKHHSSRFTRVLRSGLTINTMAGKEASKQKLKSPESHQSYTSLGSTSPKIGIQERTKKSTEQLEEIAREVGYKRNSSVSAKENGLATCELIKRDRDGKVILPQQIGVMIVCNLRQAKTKPDTFHTRNYIYPVGYTIQRMMASMVQPGVRTLYTFTFEDGGETPIFKITCADNPTKPMTSRYCTPAVRELFTKIERATSPSRQKDATPPCGGMWFGSTTL